MKKYNRHFTLVEMLTVVAIIGILAGLIIPTVVISQKKGRVTQAKTDISSITTALKQLKTDYGRILVKSSSGDYYAGSVAADKETFDCSGLHTGNHTVAKLSGDSYDAFIAELSVPKNSVLTALSAANQKLCINRRRKVYLDPQGGFNPAEAYTTDANKEKLYRDPWGSPYVVYIGVDTSHEIKISGNSKYIAAETAVYSFGPNGTDDKGCNVELESCIYSADSSNHKNHDDIASWNL